MRRIIGAILIAVLVALLGGLGFVYSGHYDIAATEPHWPVTRWVLDTPRTRSIKVHAAGIEAPPRLYDPAKLLIGIDHFAAHCAVCHGAPGVPKGDIAQGALSAAAGSRRDRRRLQRWRTVLDPQAWHQDDRHAGLGRPQRRRAVGDGRVPAQAARHDASGEGGTEKTAARDGRAHGRLVSVMSP
jgi:hypothetical protein